MSLDSGHSAADDRVEHVVGNLLRGGVLIAAAVAIVGGIAHLWHLGGARSDYHVFRGDPAKLRSVAGLVRGALAFDTACVIQLGIVLLIATPVARVALTVVAFALRRDRMYVAVSTIVLVLLAWSLFAS